MSSTNDLSSPVDVYPVLSGWLAKLGQHIGSNLQRNWTRRYFTLAAGTLSYFATPNDATARGTL
eukprot:SAG31_NODE_20701_length_567_cov_1.324786_2_plen_63_part_01